MNEWNIKQIKYHTLHEIIFYKNVSVTRCSFVLFICVQACLCIFQRLLFCFYHTVLPLIFTIICIDVFWIRWIFNWKYHNNLEFDLKKMNLNLCDRKLLLFHHVSYTKILGIAYFSIYETFKNGNRNVTWIFLHRIII